MTATSFTDLLLENRSDSPDEYDSPDHPSLDPIELSNLLSRLSHGKTHGYVSPEAGDVRCGCPALNALANHSYINHSGRNVSFEQLSDCLHRVYGLTVSFASTLAKRAFIVCMTDPRSSKRINLDMIQEPVPLHLRPDTPLLPFLHSTVNDESNPDLESDLITDFDIFEAIRRRQEEFDKLETTSSSPFYNPKLPVKATVFYPHITQHLEWALVCSALEPEGIRVRFPSVKRAVMLDFLEMGKLPAKEAVRPPLHCVDLAPLEFDILFRWGVFMEVFKERKDITEEERQAHEGLWKEMVDIMEAVVQGDGDTRQERSGLKSVEFA